MPNWKKVIVSGSDASLNTLNVSTSLTASGLIYPATDNGEESFIQTNGSGILSLQYVKTIYEEIYNGEATSILKGTPVYVSGSVGAASIVYIADAGNPAKMPVVYVSADTIASGETGRGIALGLIKGVDTTGYPAGTEIFVGVGGGWTSTRPTGSAIIQVLGYVTKEGNGGQGVILNPGPANLPNLNSGSIWVGNSSSIPVAIPTSSIQNVISSSYALSASNATTASYILNAISSSFATTSSYADNFIVRNYLFIDSASLDFQQNTNVTTGSYQVVLSVATGSFRCAFFDYVTFSGSISRAGTVYTVWSGSTTEFTETSTNDIGGSTAIVDLRTAISGSNIQLQSGISGSAWSVRSLVRLL